MATWMVRARSAAEIPVLTPLRASIETVKAVSNGDSFLAAMRSRPSSSQRSGVSARQMRPPPSLRMKLIASGVTNWAAIVRSPSFSRLSSSQTTTILPWRMSSMASSMVENGVRTELIRPPLAGDVRLEDGRRMAAWRRRTPKCIRLWRMHPTRRSTYFANTSTSRFTRVPGPAHRA